MYSYRYTKDDEPLEHCPGCASRLTAPNMVLVDLIGTADDLWTMNSALDDNGVLLDPYGDIAMGRHSATRCWACGEQLINMEGVVETNINE